MLTDVRLLHRLRPHHIRFSLELFVIVDRDPLRLHRGLHTALHLLHRMPTFMRQMLLLTRTDVNVLSLGVRQRVELGRFGGIAVDAHA